MKLTFVYTFTYKYQKPSRILTMWYQIYKCSRSVSCVCSPLWLLPYNSPDLQEKLQLWSLSFPSDLWPWRTQTLSPVLPCWSGWMSSSKSLQSLWSQSLYGMCPLIAVHIYMFQCFYFNSVNQYCKSKKIPTIYINHCKYFNEISVCVLNFIYKKKLIKNYYLHHISLWYIEEE